MNPAEPCCSPTFFEPCCSPRRAPAKESSAAASSGVRMRLLRRWILSAERSAGMRRCAGSITPDVGHCISDFWAAGAAGAAGDSTSFFQNHTARRSLAPALRSTSPKEAGRRVSRIETRAGRLSRGAHRGVHGTRLDLFDCDRGPRLVARAAAGAAAANLLIRRRRRALRQPAAPGFR